MSKLTQARDLLMLEEQIRDDREFLTLIADRAAIEIIELTKIVEWNQGLINNKRQMIAAIEHHLGEKYATTSEQPTQGESETNTL